MGDQASRGGQLGGTRPAREGSWEWSSLQGGQLGVNILTEGQLGINQAVRGVVRG